MLYAKCVWNKALLCLGTGDYMEYRIPGITALAGERLALCFEGRAAVRDDWSQIDAVVMVSADGGETFHKAHTVTERASGAVTYNNPALIADGQTLHLIYHKDYAQAFHTKSEDFGASWRKPHEITSAFHELKADWNVCATGPGHGVRLENGRLVAPVWIANGKRIDSRRAAHAPSAAGSIYSDDGGDTWHGGALIPAADVLNANETCIVETAAGVLFNFRNCDPVKKRYLALSPDGASGYAQARFQQELTDPGCFGGMARLADGSILFANCDSPARRHQVTVKRSVDGGQTWQGLIDVAELGGYVDVAVWGQDLYVLYEACGAEADFPIQEIRLAKYRLMDDG